MANSNSTPMGHPLGSNPPTQAMSGSDWVQLFQVDGLSLLLGAGVAIDDLVMGASTEKLRQLADEDVLDIRANLGANRRCLALALHHERAKKGSILVDLDGDRHDAHTTVARLVSILSELASSAEAKTFRDSIRASTVFVDNVQFLCDTSIAALQGLIERRIEGGVVPRLMVGTVAGCEAKLIGLATFNVAPLSERPEDVEAFVTRRFQSRRNSPSVGEDAMSVLRNWSWPREEVELLNFVDRAQLMYANQTVSAEAAEEILTGNVQGSRPDQLLADVEEAHIYRVLEHHNWNRTRSAKALGIDVKTLYNKLRRYESKKRLQANQAHSDSHTHP